MIQIENLTAGYSNKDVIRGFSLTIPEGSLLFLLGRNGSGKSTFLQAISGQLRYEGSIKTSGHELNKINLKEKAGQISFLAQQNNSAFQVNILDLVVSGRFHQKKNLEGYSKTDFEEAETLINSLPFTHKAGYLNELSGGETQMVWLAQIQFQNTPIILLDEPTQHLDLYYKKQVFNQIANWQAKGKTQIVSTHDIGYLSNFENAEILFFKKGKPPLVYKCTAETISILTKEMENDFSY